MQNSNLKMFQSQIHFGTKCIVTLIVNVISVLDVYEDAINDIYCDTNSKYFSANIDENHVLYVDFEHNQVVSTLPEIVGPIPWDKFYGLIFAYAYNEMMEFKGFMEDMRKGFGNPPEMEGEVQLPKSFPFLCVMAGIVNNNNKNVLLCGMCIKM